uniref:Uncharacterized protein n=1 Tax=Opuntia streptacantha TaxID=393608 RepID=A0A7C8YZX1_OPUST
MAWFGSSHQIWRFSIFEQIRKQNYHHRFRIANNQQLFLLFPFVYFRLNEVELSSTHSDLPTRRPNHFHPPQKKMKIFLSKTLKLPSNLISLQQNNTKAIDPADKQTKPGNEPIKPRSSKNAQIIHHLNLTTEEWIQRRNQSINQSTKIDRNLQRAA